LRGEGVVATSGETKYGIKTYRYLRIAMASLVVCLLASVVYEYAENPQSCWQGSLSAYYYTPARPIFVAALLAIGVCMVVLLAYPPIQDVVLNVGGFLAIIVALVPTPNKGTCMSVPFQSEERAANVANNMTAFFVGAVIAMIVTVATAASEKDLRAPTVDDLMPKDRDAAVKLGGILVEALLLVGGVIWFFGFPDHFDQNAHWVAASALCLAIIVIVAMNARDARRAPKEDKKKKYFLIYVFLAGAMFASTVIILIIQAITDWDHATLVIEVVLIALFGVFWSIQTKDLWDEEVRPDVRSLAASGSGP